MPIPVALLAGIIQGGLALTQFISSKKKADEAEQLMNDYESQNITNPYLKMEKYPSLAYQSARDAANTQLATNVSAASQYGRGLANIPQATAMYAKQGQELQSEIAKYGLQRDAMIAGGEQDKQKLIAGQEEAYMNALGTNAGINQYNQNEALVSLGNAAVYGADAYNQAYGSPNATAGSYAKNFTDSLYKPKGVSIGSSIWDANPPVTKAPDYLTGAPNYPTGFDFNFYKPK